MTLYAFVTGLISLTFFLTGLYVYIQSTHRLLYQRCFIFSTSVALWALGYFITLLEIPDYQINIAASRFSHAFGALIPIAYLNFVWAILHRQPKQKLFAGAYLFSGIMFVLCLTPLVVKELLPKMGLKYYPEWGALYPIYSSLFLIFPGYAQYEMGKEILRVRGTERTRLIYFFVALALAFSGGVSLFLLIFNVPFPPYLSVLIILYPPMMAYTILVYRFMDIEVIIKRTLVFAGLSFILFGLFTTSAFVVSAFLQDSLGDSERLLLFAVVGMIAATIVRPLDTFLVNITDRYLFQKKFDYQKLLKDASRGIALIQSLDHLAKLIITFLTLRARIKNAALYIRSDNEKFFVLIAARGYNNQATAESFTTDHALIAKLNALQQPLRLDDLLNVPEKDNSENKAVIESMKNISAQVVIPSFLGMQSGMETGNRDRGLLRSILVLGDKKSDDAYSDEDMNVFFTIAQESAIAIENARLYDEAVKRAKELEKINDELNAASSRLMHALSETEDANKRLKDTQSQLVHEQKMATMGRLAASVGHEVNNPLTVLSMNVSRVLLRLRKEPELRVSEITPVFDKMEQNIQRIKAVVNTLTGLLKKSEKGRFEALSVKILIEETLPLVQFQTYLDNLTGTEVEFDIPGDIALIKGDLERLQEVFLNLFINAYQAMMNSRERRIRITARNDYTTKMVTIDFADTGDGIPEDVIKKLFHFRFTTKPEGKGSGIGLYMCRYILELHGGEISVKSKLGVGSTFTIKLPIYEDRSTLNTQGGGQASATG